MGGWGWGTPFSVEPREIESIQMQPLIAERTANSLFRGFRLELGLVSTAAVAVACFTFHGLDGVEV